MIEDDIMKARIFFNSFEAFEIVDDFIELKKIEFHNRISHTAYTIKYLTYKSEINLPFDQKLFDGEFICNRILEEDWGDVCRWFEYPMLSEFYSEQNGVYHLKIPISFLIENDLDKDYMVELLNLFNFSREIKARKL